MIELPLRFSFINTSYYLARIFLGGSGDRNLMQFRRFRRPAPARLTRNEESEARTWLHFRQLLPSRATVSTLILFPRESPPKILRWLYVKLH